MSNNAETAAYSALQPNDILSALEALDFRCNGRLLALNSYENRVYQVGIEQHQPIVVKFYRPARWSDAAIIEEHTFARQLAEQEIPVVPPSIVHGETLHRHGAFRLAVFPWHGGRAPELDDFAMLRQAGRLVARMHCIGELENFRHRPSLDVQTFGIQSQDYLLDNDFIPEDLFDAYDSLANDVISGVETCISRTGHIGNIRLHGDFHPGNVLQAGETLHIVDLDDARGGPAIQDLWMFLSGDREEQIPQLEALLEGYTAFRNFNALELHLIEALRSLRIMHYAAWLARRWQDPAFQRAFPWFDSHRYWDDHVLALREQLALMQEPPLAWQRW